LIDDRLKSSRLEESSVQQHDPDGPTKGQHLILTHRGTSVCAWKSRMCGQSLVELAVTLPLLLLIMLGTIDIGRAFFDYIEMRNAVFEGARYGARFSTDTAGIQSRVTQHGVPADTVVATPVLTGGTACTTIGGTCYITVTATRTFTPITTGFLQEFFGLAPFTMSVSATMRVMT
jgi:Flp pilus assembly protein TadG